MEITLDKTTFKKKCLSLYDTYISMISHGFRTKSLAMSYNAVMIIFFKRYINE